MEMLGHLWNLITSGLKIFLIAFLASGIILWLSPDEMKGLIAFTVKVIFIVSLSGTIVNAGDFLRIQVPQWLERRARSAAAISRQKSNDEMTLSSVYHLNDFEKDCLRKAIAVADDTGLFRKWTENRRRYDDPTVESALMTLRERKIVEPSNPDQSQYNTSSVDFWKLTAVVVRNRPQVLDMLS
ncbi:hypothetical protein ACSV5S_10975 [Agrobacterium deltaense]|uniref:hypothetical protein n=1 Tax=Agrobacterium deltaense TaxID=1183412 RepID=UPI003FD1946B